MSLVSNKWTLSYVGLHLSLPVCEQLHIQLKRWVHFQVLFENLRPFEYIVFKFNLLVEILLGKIDDCQCGIFFEFLKTIGNVLEIFIILFDLRPRLLNQFLHL